MDAIIDFLNNIFWGYVLIYGLLAVGIYFTIRLGFVQFLHFREMWRCVKGSGEVDRRASRRSRRWRCRWQAAWARATSRASRSR